MTPINRINKFILGVILGFFVSYIIYVRLILVRLPKELICTEETFLFYLLSLSILLSVLFSKIFIYISMDAKETIWMQKIKNKIQLEAFLEYYDIQLKKCHQFLIDKIPSNGNFVNFVLDLVIKHYLILRIIYFGLTYGPRYILALIFFTESIFFHKISVFYSFIPLLFIPLFCQYMLFTVNNFAKTNLESLSNCIEVEVIFSESEKYNITALAYNEYLLALDSNTEVNAFINFTADYQEYLQRNNKDILKETRVMVLFLYSLIQFNTLWIYLNKLKFKYNIYFQLGSIIIYIISWIYIIFCTGESAIEMFKLQNKFLFLDKEEPFSGIFL